jgi:DNA-binding NtrC family response regulator
MDRDASQPDVNTTTQCTVDELPEELFDVVDLRPPEVLVVEDDDAMRELIAMTLTDQGYRVVETVDSEHALHILDRRRHREPVDAIVVDMWMPGLTGLELMEELRSHDWSTPVIFVSAFVTGQVYEEAKRLGAYRVFPKPLKLQELTATLEEVAPTVWS